MIHIHLINYIYLMYFYINIKSQGQTNKSHRYSFFQRRQLTLFFSTQKAKVHPFNALFTSVTGVNIKHTTKIQTNTHKEETVPQVQNYL